MQTSEQISEIATALSAAQAEMKPALKDATNPAYRSKYADLTAVWEACRGPLTKHKLAVLQDATMVEQSVSVVTRLVHASGQWIEFGPLVIPMAKADAHGVGSAISYAKRYGLSAAIGVVAEDDDDGESAVGRSAAAAPAKAKPAGFDSWLTDLEAVAIEGVDPLKKAWEASRANLRSYLTSTQMARWEAIKAKAAQNNAVPA